MQSRLQHKSTINSAVTLLIVFLCFTRETGEFLFAPMYDRLLLVIDAQILMGHRSSSRVHHWVTGISFLSFFSHLNVTKMQSAKWRKVELWLRVLPSLMKAIFRRQSCFICRCSTFGTFVYSHECITQKWAAPVNLPIAWWSSVDFEERMRRRTQTGRAFFIVLPLYRLSFMVLVDAEEVVQCGWAWHLVWGCFDHFPSWRPQPHCWGNLRLCFQPGGHQVVKKIGLDAQPRWDLRWFRFGEFGNMSSRKRLSPSPMILQYLE